MGEDNEDRISKLSDDLIFHIFSFMEPKFAVQTCVLSKRWVNLWTTLPYFNFSNLDNISHFWQRLYSNIALHFIYKRNHQSHITTFQIDLRPFEVTEADSIVEYAICHNVQRLRVSRWFLNFGLVSLVLKTLHLSHCEASLMDWEMPVLETLHLDHVTVLGDIGNTMSLKGYKNLKAITLIVDTEYYSYLKAFDIDCPYLQNLTVLLVGRYMESNCDYVISAPNLSYFMFGCQDISHLSVLKVSKSAETNFLCLKDVELDIDIDELDWKCCGLERRKQVIQKVIGLFYEFRTTKFLSLSFETIQASFYSHAYVIVLEPSMHILLV